MRSIKISFLLMLCCTVSLVAQNTKEDDLGAWYMYFYSTKFKNTSFGVQGDLQYRNFNTMGDLEQLLIRSALTYSPQGSNITLALGYANITSGRIGENDDTTTENRIYQEALLPLKVGERLYFTHRFRYEQRFVENQDFRTRFRYNLAVSIPINKNKIEKNTLYAAFYNEIFLNGEKNIGDGRIVNVFDRNRFYAGLGYGITNKIRAQVGYMNQSTETAGKDQLQFSIHHNF